MRQVYTKFLMFGLTALLTSSLSYQCKTTFLTAPDKAMLLVSINPPEIPVGGQAVVTVLGYKDSGAPLADGTTIFFSTDIGSIDAAAETNGGTAHALFRSDDNRSGTAHIGVSSGNADVSPTTNTITITSPELSRLVLTANPRTLPFGGGVSQILVIAYDDDSLPIPGIPVIITSDTGTLENQGRALTTDAVGEAQDRLSTAADTVVTAKSGDVTGSVEVKVKSNSSPSASFVYSPENPKAGEDIYFNAAESKDEDGYIVRFEWDFGDGKTAAGEKVRHRYAAANSYKVILTVYDNNGAKGTAVQTVTVSVPSPGE